jgi:hypothetical protein
MARGGATETAPRPISSAPALGLKSTYRREVHLAFCPSRQLIEVANIFSALRAHHVATFPLRNRKTTKITRANRSNGHHQRVSVSVVACPRDQAPNCPAHYSLDESRSRNCSAVRITASPVARCWRRECESSMLEIIPESSPSN